MKYRVGLFALIAAALIVGQAAAQSYIEMLPPPEFDKPYRGVLYIYRADEIEFKQLWKIGTTTQPYNPKVVGFARLSADKKQCDVFILKDQYLKKRSVGFGSVLRHELGHCNGWPGDHRGGRLVRIAVDRMPELPPDTRWEVSLNWLNTMPPNAPALPELDRPLILPPPEFDVPFRGIVTIWRTQSIEHNKELPFIGRDHRAPIAFARPPGSHDGAENHCQIFIVKDEVLKPLGFSLALLLRHELAHCNGWPADHPDGKKVPATFHTEMPELPPGTPWLNAIRER